jgi:hypothetical protein
MNTRPQPNPETMPDEVLKRLNISREDYIQVKADANEREKRVPHAGSKAPEFNLERLDDGGKRSGEFVRLSESKGRPVVLYFGSYT